MERTLISVVKNDDEMRIEMAGTMPELATVAATIVARISIAFDAPIMTLGLALLSTAEKIKSKEIGKVEVRPDVDAEKYTDDIFEEILRGDRNED